MAATSRARLPDERRRPAAPPRRGPRRTITVGGLLGTVDAAATGLGETDAHAQRIVADHGASPAFEPGRRQRAATSFTVRRMGGEVSYDVHDLLKRARRRARGGPRGAPRPTPPFVRASSPTRTSTRRPAPGSPPRPRQTAARPRRRRPRRGLQERRRPLCGAARRTRRAAPKARGASQGQGLPPIQARPLLPGGAPAPLRQGPRDAARLLRAVLRRPPALQRLHGHGVRLTKLGLRWRMPHDRFYAKYAIAARGLGVYSRAFPLVVKDTDGAGDAARAREAALGRAAHRPGPRGRGHGGGAAGRGPARQDPGHAQQQPRSEPRGAPRGGHADLCELRDEARRAPPPEGAAEGLRRRQAGLQAHREPRPRQAHAHLGPQPPQGGPQDHGPLPRGADAEAEGDRDRDGDEAPALGARGAPRRGASPSRPPSAAPRRRPWPSSSGAARGTKRRGAELRSFVKDRVLPRSAPGRAAPRATRPRARGAAPTAGAPAGRPTRRPGLAAVPRRARCAARRRPSGPTGSASLLYGASASSAARPRSSSAGRARDSCASGSSTPSSRRRSSRAWAAAPRAARTRGGGASPRWSSRSAST